jgi:hypothetical protein
MRGIKHDLEHIHREYAESRHAERRYMNRSRFWTILKTNTEGERHDHEIRNQEAN